ncbi:MAG: hypothetical protein V4550_18525 [Gemmatimonadota bacterium]
MSIDRPRAYRPNMQYAEEQRYGEAIHRWADQMIREIEESLAKHAEFERLYPEPDEATLASDRQSPYTPRHV